MKDVTILLEKLKKVDYPHTIPEDASEVVHISPETLLFAIAISAKRIADALEDGLTAVSGEKFTGVADLLSQIEMSIRNKP